MFIEDNLPIDTPNDADRASIVASDGGESLQQDVTEDPTTEIVAEFDNIEYPDFDPTIHAVNDDGTPKLRGDGTYAKKRGRKPGAAKTETLTKPAAPKPEVVAQEPGLFAGNAATTITNKEAAKQLRVLCTSVAAVMIGPEWLPSSPDEAKMLDASITEYFNANGQIQVGPGWGVILAITAYSLPRIQHENTQTKLQKFGGWLRDRYIWAKGKFGWGK